MTVAFTTFLTWHDLRPIPDANAEDTAAAIIRNVFPSGGAAAVIVIILAEVLQYIVATLDYLRNKWVKPLIDRYRAEGRAEGRAEMYEQLREWLERREVAQQAGMPFDEPPPSPEQPA